MRLPATYEGLLAAGVSRRSLRTALGNDGLTRPWRGAYTVDNDEISRIQALFQLLPPQARLANRSAAAWFGFGVLPSIKIHIVVPQGWTHPRLAGVEARESVLPLPEPVLLHGVPLLPPTRVAIDLARTSRRLDALPVLDAALRAGVTSTECLSLEVAGHTGLRGVRQARELVPLADERAECAQESQLRLIIVDGGLPAPEPQLPVGWFRLDLGYRGRRVGIEYDGRSHLSRERLRSDRARMNWLAGHGWAMRYFTDQDIYRNRRNLLRTVGSLLS